jgi:hypothetical protein
MSTTNNSSTEIVYETNNSTIMSLSGSDILITEQSQTQNPNVIRLNSLGVTYNTITTVWENLAIEPELIQSLTTTTNGSTLNINNTIQIQNGETIDVPTQTILISSDVSGNRIAIDGNYGLPTHILTSGGTDSSIYWGVGGGGQVGTLADVLTNGNTANKNIDMNSYSINNISSLSIDSLSIGNLSISTPPLPLSSLTITGLGFPITIDGTLYYLPLYINP